MEITSRLGTVLNNRGWCSPPFLDNLLTVVCTVARWYSISTKKGFHTLRAFNQHAVRNPLVSPDILCPVGAYLLIQPLILDILSIRNQEVKRVKWAASHLAQRLSGTPIPLTRLYWYLIGTLSVPIKRFQVKIASCYQGLGQSQHSLLHSKAEYIEVGYVSSKDDNWLFYCSETHWEAKVAPLSG